MVSAIFFFIFFSFFFSNQDHPWYELVFLEVLNLFLDELSHRINTIPIVLFGLHSMGSSLINFVSQKINSYSDENTCTYNK
jgi:hypothetical protein